MVEGAGSREGDPGRNTRRCFVAIPAPPGVRERAAEIQEALRGRAGLEEVRWLRAESLHITVKFLGSVPVEDVPYIAQQLVIVASGCWPCVLRLDRLGVFPDPRRPRVLWWGAEPESVPDKLRALHFHVEESLHLLGFEKEDRPFHPHITLGRMKGGANPAQLAEALKRPASLTEAVFPVRGFDLMESRLHPRGAVYETLAEYTLEEETPGKEG